MVFLLGLFVLIAPASLYSAEICLNNGDCLNGKIIDRSETALSLQHPNLGLITIPLSEVVDPTEGGEDDPPTVAAEESLLTTEELTPGKEVMTQQELLPTWGHKVSFGISGEEGNDTGLVIRTDYSTAYEDDFDRWGINAGYLYETEDRKKDESKGHFRITKDWLQPDHPWFYYLQGRYNYDSFKYWKHRITAFVGSGYDWVKDDNLEIIGRLGVGGSKTWGIDNRIYPEGQLGIESTWRPDAINELQLEAAVFPDLGDYGEFRTFSKLEWRIKFNVKKGLGFRSAVEHEYESEINEYENNEKHYDLTYYWGVEIEF